MAEYRQWRETNRTMLKDVIPLDTPYNLSFEVSSFCNARCVYCAHSGKHGQYEGNMTEELFHKVLSDAKGFNRKIKKCGMFGFGESLCNPNLPYMIKEVNKSGLVEAVDLTTNGLLLTPELSDKLLEAGLGTIRISIQGIDADMYWRMCKVKVDFEKFLDNLRYLYENRGKTKVRFKIADMAIKDVPDGEKNFIEIFGGMADSVFVEHIMPIYSIVDYDVLDKSILRESLNGRERVAQTKVNKVCHRAFYRCRIRANGDITAACCDATKDVVFGNALGENVVQVWNGESRREFLKKQLLGQRFAIEECKRCMMPNDITTEEDLLDPWMEEILKRWI